MVRENRSKLANLTVSSRFLVQRPARYDRQTALTHIRPSANTSKTSTIFHSQTSGLFSFRIMDRSLFANASYFPRGIFALATLTLILTVVFHARFPFEVHAQQFINESAAAPASTDSKTM